MDTVVFLGAGASKADGAPTQGELFKKYFQSPDFRYVATDDVKNTFREFFLSMFNIDVCKANLNTVKFPTFEEVLGILDLAELRRETFKGFDLENMTSNSGSLRHLRNNLVLAMAEAVDSGLRGRATAHPELVRNLLSHDLLQRTAFISTNYDILIDNALLELVPNPARQISYGIEFRNPLTPPGLTYPPRKGIKLLKIHGSLNWLYCPTCNNVALAPSKKVASPPIQICDYCESFLTIIVVPPTFYKDLTNVFIARIWNTAELALRTATHLVFCGYSFPDADLHVKYLIKRAQTNRKGRPLRFTIINKKLGNIERERFSRFFNGPINFISKPFEDFVRSPENVY